MMYTLRVAITCDECGLRHVLKRTFVDPSEISIVCHGCELPLVALLDIHCLPHARGASKSALRAWAHWCNAHSATSTFPLVQEEGPAGFVPRGASWFVLGQGGSEVIS